MEKSLTIGSSSKAEGSREEMVSGRTLRIEGRREMKQTEGDPTPGAGPIKSVEALLLSMWTWNWKDILSLLLVGEPVVVSGEGSSLMLEWSTPTAVALLRTLQHLKEHYQLFSSSGRTTHTEKRKEKSTVNRENRGDHPDSDSCVPSVVESGVDTSDVFQSLGRTALSFHFTDTNAFIYGLTPGTLTPLFVL